MKILGMALLMTLGTAYASTNSYDLKMDLSLNGKHVSSPRIIVKEGEVASITQKTANEEQFIDVIATKSEMRNISNGILMKFTVGTIDKNGVKHISARPQVITKENVQAKITQGNNEGKEELSLSVIASKQIQ